MYPKIGYDLVRYVARAYKKVLAKIKSQVKDFMIFTYGPTKIDLTIGIINLKGIEEFVNKY